MRLFIRIFIFLFFATNFSETFSQTALPTTWDCTPGTLPIGWTTNMTGYYTSSSYTHSAPNAAKFDATGIYVTINFVDAPDTLIYYLRGASFSGGTFTIEQSANGSTWTTIRTFTDLNIPNTSLANAAPFKDLITANSRYVRFYYTSKSSGNVSVDDITITKRPPGPEANMKVLLTNVLIPNGTTAVIGNDILSTFKVFNSGLDSVLHLSSSNITGINAEMFSVNNIPINIPPQDSAVFTVTFLAGGIDGTKTATLSIINNDIDNTPYVINLWAVKGCCATEPANTAANVSFSYVKSFKFRVDFSDSITIPDKYIVLKKSAPITEEPIDGQTYIKGDYIGDAQVCYVGSSGYFYPANVIANTHYYIKIFPVNGYSGYENYLTSSVAWADTTTLANMIGSYYNNIDTLSPTLWQDIHNLINTHTTLYYSDYNNYLVRDFESRDTVVDGRTKKALTCAYSGENYVYTEPFAFTVFSREHVYCESWMPTYINPYYTSSPEYADYHNLLPVNQNKINVYRLNYPLGEVVTTQYQYLNGKKGLDSLGQVVFEPRDENKGDCARAMFYQVLCYDGVNSNDWYLPTTISSSILYGQNQDLLKRWSIQDPPDNWEIARNDIIYYYQSNRNPFIDHPEWIYKFGFGVNSNISESSVFNNKTNIFPNPTNGKITLVTDQYNNANIEIYNQTGIKVYSTKVNESKTNLDLSIINPGIYFLKVLNDGILYKTFELIILPN